MGTSKATPKTRARGSSKESEKRTTSTTTTTTKGPVAKASKQTTSTTGKRPAAKSSTRQAPVRAVVRGTVGGGASVHFVPGAMLSDDAASIIDAVVEELAARRTNVSNVEIWAAIDRAAPTARNARALFESVTYALAARDIRWAEDPEFASFAEALALYETAAREQSFTTERSRDGHNATLTVRVGRLGEIRLNDVAHWITPRPAFSIGRIIAPTKPTDEPALSRVERRLTRRALELRASADTTSDS